MKRGRKSSNNFVENGKKVWKCGKYKRLSKEDGHDVSYSIENQDQILNHFLAGHPEIEIVDDYQDDGRTDTDSDRDDFQRLLSDIYAKRINCVIVKDLSRLSRNDYECGHYLEYVFVSLDVRFISVELPALEVTLIKQISIYEGKRIEVEFNFADQHQRILDFIEANQEKLHIAEHEAI